MRRRRDVRDPALGARDEVAVRADGRLAAAGRPDYLLREDELRRAVLRLAPPRLDAAFRVPPDFAPLDLDALLRDDVPLDALLLDPVLRAEELRPAPLLAVVRRLALRPLRVALAPAVLAALVTDDAAFSRFLTSDWLVLRASLRSDRNVAATSLYAVRALPPRSLRIDCSACVASSSAFSKRAVACSTSLRVTDLDELARDFVELARDLVELGRRVAGFFAGGMLVLLLTQ